MDVPTTLTKLKFLRDEANKRLDHGEPDPRDEAIAQLSDILTDMVSAFATTPSAAPGPVQGATTPGAISRIPIPSTDVHTDVPRRVKV